MPTVDLPAHSVTLTSPTGFGSEIIGGPEALAEEDTASYVRLSTFGVGIQMYNGGDPGFGYVDIPGVTITNVDLVAYGYRETGGAYPPEHLDPDEEPTAEYPTLLYNFEDDGYLAGLNMDGFPIGSYGWASSPLASQHWFRLLDPSDLPPGEGRLSPRFDAGPDDAWRHFPEAVIRIAYLAARVTYTATEPPCRLYPRDDRLARGSRIYPPPRTRQGGRSNGYL